MAWTRLASRSRLRPAASASHPRASPPAAPSSSRPLRRLLQLPLSQLRLASSASAARLLGDVSPRLSPAPYRLRPCLPARAFWFCLGLGAAAARGDVGRCFASEASAAPAGETAAELVEVPLAQTGEGIAECELLRWFVTEGDQVDEFQPLCEVQSDKTTIEITSRFKGKVHQIHFGPGDIVKVGETLLKMIVGDSHVVSHDDIAPPTDKSLGVDSTHPLGEGNIPSGTLSTPAVRHLAK